ncbi:DUF3450 domain-containing protein [Candidatus Gracilibacteria bacterium]|nr:DUF3450 domain-containing protein [Candidatus Gracilibacteria bacterium]
MIKKILLLFVVLTVLYALSIFIFPSVTAKIDSLLGMPGFSESIRGKKTQFDTIVTNPDVGVLPNSYSDTLSGARDVQNKFNDGVESTKNTIDGFRGQAQEMQGTIEKGKEQIESIKRVYDEASGTYIEIKTLIDGTQEIIGSGSISSQE